MEKKLVRSTTNKKLMGVCGGLGQYFDVDPKWFRIGFAALVLAKGVGVFVYLVAAFLMNQGTTDNQTQAEPTSEEAEDFGKDDDQAEPGDPVEEEAFRAAQADEEEMSRAAKAAEEEAARKSEAARAEARRTAEAVREAAGYAAEAIRNEAYRAAEAFRTEAKRAAEASRTEATHAEASADPYQKEEAPRMDQNAYWQYNKEKREAIEAGHRALQSLNAAQQELNSARNWGVADMLASRSPILSMVKHSKMDQARRNIEQARNDLQRFSRELRDVDVTYSLNLETGDLLSFADVFFDNFVVDLMMQDRINQARRQVEEAISRVQSILRQLES